MFALFAFCTQMAQLPDLATDRGAYKKPKVKKMDGIPQITKYKHESFKHLAPVKHQFKKF